MILVTGATGQFGSKAVDHLVKKGLDPNEISVLVRDASKAVGLKEKGVHIRQGDYSDHTSMVRAFQGVDKLLLVSSNNRDAFENRTLHHKNAINAAVEAKVRHIIYTSFLRKPGYEDSAIAAFQNSHVASENYLKGCGIDYTILQNGIYAEMIPAFAGDAVEETETIFFPAGGGRASWVLRDELAEAAACVLATDGHRDKTYSLTNTESVGFSAIAQHISKAVKKDVSYKSPEADEFKLVMEKAGMPDMYVGMLAMWGAALAEQALESEGDTLAALLGRAPTTAGEFLAKMYGAELY